MKTSVVLMAASIVLSGCDKPSPPQPAPAEEPRAEPAPNPEATEHIVSFDVADPDLHPHARARLGEERPSAPSTEGADAASDADRSPVVTHGWSSVWPRQANGGMSAYRCAFEVPAHPHTDNDQTLYLYCEVVASSSDTKTRRIFGQFVPQLMTGNVFGCIEEKSPHQDPKTQWAIQAQYFFQDASGNGKCKGGAVIEVQPEDKIISEIGFRQDEQQRWVGYASIFKDGASPNQQSTITVEHPQLDPAYSWEDYLAVGADPVQEHGVWANAALEAWDTQEATDYPGVWVVDFSFAALEGVSLTPDETQQQADNAHNSTPAQTECKVGDGSLLSSCIWQTPSP